MVFVASQKNDIEVLVNDDDKKFYLNYFLEMLPQKIIDDFNDNDWEIIIDDKNSEYFEKYKNTNVIGLTNFTQKKIILSKNSEALFSATIHEFGHYVDYLNGKISETDEFLDIMKKESKAYRKNFLVFINYNFTHANKDSQEYFAEMFQQYIMFPNITKLYAPLTCEYIQEIIDSL